MFQWSTYLLVKLFQFWDSLNLFIFLFSKSQKPSADVIYPDNNFELAWKHAYAKFLSHFVNFTYENCFKFGTQQNCFGQHKFEGKLCIEWQFVMTNKFFFLVYFSQIMHENIHFRSIFISRFFKVWFSIRNLCTILCLCVKISSFKRIKFSIQYMDLEQTER